MTPQERDWREDILLKTAREFGTPCYVYILDDIVERSRRIRDAFGRRFGISYAVKANPNQTLLMRLRAHVDMLDVSSGGELDLALRCGYAPERISFSGPAKSGSELMQAIAAGPVLIIAESLGELRELQSICTNSGARARILLRLSPRQIPKGFGVNMAGKPSQFGIDEEDVSDVMFELRALDRLDLVGLHIYSGTQCLDPESIAENLANYMDLFERTCAEHELEPKLLLFGSGFGIPYHAGDEGLDLRSIAPIVNERMDRMRTVEALSTPRCHLELGRFLVGEAGYFLTGVRRVKRSRGRQLMIMDGGLNHHLAACGHFGSVIPRNYRVFKLGPSEGEQTPVDLFGPLCTTIDQLGRGIELPPLEEGDVVAVCSSGAYGLTASPIHFIGHPPPRELLVQGSEGDVAIDDVSWLS